MPLASDAVLPFDQSRLNDCYRIIPVTKARLKAGLEDENPRVQRWADGSGFNADVGEILEVPDENGDLALVLLGMGDDGPHLNDPWFIAPAAEKLKPRLYMLCWPVEARRVHEGALLVWALTHYRFDRYKPDNTDIPRLMAQDSIDIDEVCAFAEAAALTRDLVNTPAEDMGPPEIEDAAAELAEAFGASVSSIVGDDLLDEKLPAIHMVGRAATEARAPRLVEIKWRSERACEHAPSIAVVGKGVCFDSGGLNIKPGGGMRMMKKDMGGAAHALGLSRLIMQLDLPIELHTLIPAVDNAIAGESFRPGDVMQTRSGKTVEIDNTDAEGRLVLSDALTKACEGKPSLVVDFATLTGAARIALGPDLPATYANEDGLWDALETAAEDAADPLWRMPLWDAYRKDFKSSIADLCNMADHSFAGSIIAALFLEEFVSPGTPWVHIDLFAWNPRSKPGRPVGASCQSLFAVFGAIRQRFSV